MTLSLLLSDSHRRHGRATDETTTAKTTKQEALVAVLDPTEESTSSSLFEENEKEGGHHDVLMFTSAAAATAADRAAQDDQTAPLPEVHVEDPEAYETERGDAFPPPLAYGGRLSSLDTVKAHNRSSASSNSHSSSSNNRGNGAARSSSASSSARSSALSSARWSAYSSSSSSSPRHSSYRSSSTTTYSSSSPSASAVLRRSSGNSGAGIGGSALPLHHEEGESSSSQLAPPPRELGPPQRSDGSGFSVSTTGDTDSQASASMRSLRLRRHLVLMRRQHGSGSSGSSMGWQDEGLHEPSVMSSLRSSHSTVQSSFSQSRPHPPHHHHAVENPTTSLDEYDPDGSSSSFSYPPAQLQQQQPHEFHFTPIVDVVPEGDKLSLRELPATLVEHLADPSQSSSSSSSSPAACSSKPDDHHNETKQPCLPSHENEAWVAGGIGTAPMAQVSSPTTHFSEDIHHTVAATKECDQTGHNIVGPNNAKEGESSSTAVEMMPLDASHSMGHRTNTSTTTTTAATILDPDDAWLTDDAARQRIQFLFSDHNFGDLPVDFPRFDADELVTTGRHLGTGGFSHVDEIVDFRTTRTPPTSSATESTTSLPDRSLRPSTAQALLDSRKFIHSRARNHWGESRFAMKYLRDDVKQNRSKAWTGMVDLVVETRILSHLEHPHIIKLRAVARGDPLRPDNFLILDRLVETLQARMERWKSKCEQGKKKKVPLLLRPFARRNSKQDQALWEERLTNAHELSSALEHMHRHRVIHRDIKPENVGYDLRDDIKIFDFGLARQIQSTTERYHLSLMTGSLRYMAPEVALGLPYNQQCDVYSFTVLLWEMLSLQRPYDDFPDADTLIRQVFEEDAVRPKLSKKWSASVKALLSAGWHADPSQRLDIGRMGLLLRDELVATTTAVATPTSSSTTTQARPVSSSRMTPGSDAPASRRGLDGEKDDDRHTSVEVCPRRRSTHVYAFREEKQPVLLLSSSSSNTSTTMHSATATTASHGNTNHGTAMASPSPNSLPPTMLEELRALDVSDDDDEK